MRGLVLTGCLVGTRPTLSPIAAIGLRDLFGAVPYRARTHLAGVITRQVVALCAYSAREPQGITYAGDEPRCVYPTQSGELREPGPCRVGTERLVQRSAQGLFGLEDGCGVGHEPALG